MSQHDFNIANQSFPATRTDLNNALVALASNSSGDAEPATKYANQWWYETDTNTLKLRNEANDAWISIAVLDQSGNAVQSITTAGLTLGSTAISATGTEINILDGLSRGSLIYGNASAATAVLTKGPANTFLKSDGTDIAWSTVSTGTPSVVFPADWGSPTATYASSTTWSRGSIGADDYVWFYGINGGQGTHGKHPSFNEGYGGGGGSAWFVYGQAGFFDGAAIVIGAGGVAVNTWNQYGAGGATTITTSSSNGSLAYPTNGNFVSVPTSGTYWQATPTSDFSLDQKITLPVTIGGVVYSRLTSAGRGQGNPIFGAGRGADFDATSGTGVFQGRGTSLYGGQGGGNSSAAAGAYPGGGGSCNSTAGGYGGVGAAGNLRMYAV